MSEEHQSFTVIAYDIPDDRRRLRVANLLKDFGERVQYSVFEAYLSDSQRVILEKRLLKEIELSEDKVRIYEICASCVKKVKIFGSGELWEEPDVIII